MDTSDDIPDFPHSIVDKEFPFELTDTQVHMLSLFTAEEWLLHCEHVWAECPRSALEVDKFLSLPIKKIVRTFQAEVQWLAPSFTPPTPTTTPSSSTSTPPTSTILLCPFMPSTKDHKKLAAFSDEEWLLYANHLKEHYTWKTPEVTNFLSLPAEMIVASFKARLSSLMSSSAATK